MEEVLAISVTPEPKLLTEDDCHLEIVPVYPLNVSVVLLVPEQTVVPPDTEPPAETGLTVMVAFAL